MNLNNTFNPPLMLLFCNQICFGLPHYVLKQAPSKFLKEYNCECSPTPRITHFFSKSGQDKNCSKP